MQRLKKYVAGVLLLAVALLIANRSQQLRANLGGRDFAAYWVAGQFLVHHQNPYDIERALGVEKQLGLSGDKPLVMRNPPWSLPMALPLGLVNAYWGWLLWTALMIAAVVFCTRASWKIYGGNDTTPGSRLRLVGYCFAPTLACVLAGQISAYILLGIILFLLLERERPFWAGAALILTAAKPQILYLFWLIFVVWTIDRKRRNVLAGLLIAFLIMTTMALYFDPAAFRHYREMLSAAAIWNEFIPTLGGALRAAIRPHPAWVQFVPAIVGTAWCARFYAANRASWSWRRHGPKILLVSLLTAPYGWFMDEIVLLPVVLQAVIPFSGRGRNLPIAALALVNTLLLGLVVLKVPVTSGWYFWSTTAWFLWYVYTRHQAPVPA